jgi:hypothetical protein
MSSQMTTILATSNYPYTDDPFVGYQPSPQQVVSNSALELEEAFLVTVVEKSCSINLGPFLQMLDQA